MKTLQIYPINRKTRSYLLVSPLRCREDDLRKFNDKIYNMFL